jgi:hypothetical protein
MAAPTFEEMRAILEEQQARNERLEARVTTPTEPAAPGEAAASGDEYPVMTRRGMLTGAAVGAAGVVGAILAVPEGVASAAGGPGTFKSSTATPAIKATNQGRGDAVLGDANSGTGVAGASKTGLGVTGATASTAAEAAAVEGKITSKTPGGFSAACAASTTAPAHLAWGCTGPRTGPASACTGWRPRAPRTKPESGWQARRPPARACTATGVVGESTRGTGVSDTSDEGGYGVYGTSDTSYGAVGVSTGGNGAYGQISANSQAGVVGRQLDASGNWALYGFGNIGASGTKSAVVPAADGGHVALYCMESPECWFEDFGSAKLSHGSVAVVLDPEFAFTIERVEYHVFLQPGAECKGLFVLDKSPSGFAVRPPGRDRAKAESGDDAGRAGDAGLTAPPGPVSGRRSLARRATARARHDVRSKWIGTVDSGF